MGFIPALVTGIAGLAGGLLNRPSTTTQNTNQDTTQQSSGSTATNNSSMPVYDPYQLQMRNFLLGQMANRTNPSYINNLVGGMVNQGVNDINASAAPQQQALQAALAARGLSYSGTAGTALANQQAGRVAQITQLHSQAPLIADQLQGNNLTSFADYLSRLPVGTQSSGTSFQSQSGTQHTSGTGQVQNPGNILGGIAAGVGSALPIAFRNYLPGGAK